LRQTFPSKPIIKSYLGIDLEEQKLIGKRDFRKKYNIPINAEVILYEADFCHDCGQLKLIDLAEKLNSQFLNTHILLIGKVKSDTYLQEMKEKLAALQLNKVVTIIKDLPSDSEELVAAYQTADYCVIPAVSFLPYKTIFKAWANRLPVICPRREDVEELFQQKNYGLLYEEDDTDKLIESLSYLRGNSGYRVRLIQNSYDYLKKNFSWQSIGQDIVSLYQNLIGRSLK
jgi:glycosyltransferase involved in cell wall biosynthesis